MTLATKTYFSANFVGRKHSKGKVSLQKKLD